MSRRFGKSISMTSGPIYRACWQWRLLPSRASFRRSFDGRFYSIRAICKRTLLAAVGSTGSLINFIVTLFVGLSLGSNALVARFMAEITDVSYRRSISIGLAVISAILTVVGSSWRDRSAMDASPPKRSICDHIRPSCQPGDDTRDGLQLRGRGPAIKGDTVRPLFYLTAAGVINVVLNLVFVLIFRMDVGGVALATAISQCISAYLVVRSLTRESGAFRLELTKLWPDRSVSWEILKIGIPAGFQGVVFSLSNLIIQSSINGFGPAAMAGSAAAQSIEAFVWFTMNAFTQSAMTFVSQNFGAKKYKRIDRIALLSCICAAVSGALLGNLAHYYGPTLLGVFDKRPEVIEAGMIRMAYVCGFYWLCGLMDCICGSIRGIGYNATPTIVSLLGACGSRILWVATIFQLPEYHTEAVLFFSYPGSWALTFLVHLACYLWMRRALSQKISPSKTSPRIAPQSQRRTL